LPSNASDFIAGKLNAQTAQQAISTWAADFRLG
jgi:hypothetical protein